MPNDIKTGDYCPEQHQRICQLEDVLRTVIKMMKRGDASSLSFGVTAAEDSIEQHRVYHVSYSQWLRDARGPAGTVTPEKVLEHAASQVRHVNALALIKAYRALAGCTLPEASAFVEQHFPEHMPKGV